MFLNTYTNALASARITVNGLNKTETTSNVVSKDATNNLPTKLVLAMVSMTMAISPKTLTKQQESQSISRFIAAQWNRCIAQRLKHPLTHGLRRLVILILLKP